MDRISALAEVGEGTGAGRGNPPASAALMRPALCKSHASGCTRLPLKCGPTDTGINGHRARTGTE